jgi:hypothetical protein
VRACGRVYVTKGAMLRRSCLLQCHVKVSTGIGAEEAASSLRRLSHTWLGLIGLALLRRCSAVNGGHMPMFKHHS